MVKRQRVFGTALIIVLKRNAKIGTKIILTLFFKAIFSMYDSIHLIPFSYKAIFREAVIPNTKTIAECREESATFQYLIDSQRAPVFLFRIANLRTLLIMRALFMHVTSVVFTNSKIASRKVAALNR